MSNKITNYIVSIDDKIYNYLNDVNYGMNKPISSFNHHNKWINKFIWHKIFI